MGNENARLGTIFPASKIQIGYGGLQRFNVSSFKWRSKLCLRSSCYKYWTSPDELLIFLSPCELLSDIAISAAASLRCGSCINIQWAKISPVILQTETINSRVKNVKLTAGWWSWYPSVIPVDNTKNHINLRACA